VDPELIDLLASLPPNQFVTFQVECDDGEKPFVSMCLFTRAPRDGWETEGDRFGHPPDSPRHRVLCPETHRYDDRVEVAVTGNSGCNAEFLSDCLSTLRAKLQR
jgi:hypothetical protein